MAFAAAVVMAGLAVRPARADVVVQIDKSSQRMEVSVDGMTRYNWPVSTGRSGYGTPSGVFHPQLMARRWFSRKYYNSPMPHAIFFYGGFAIHGTYELSRLGVARLRQAAPPACRGAVLIGRAQRPKPYANREFELSGRCSQ